MLVSDIVTLMVKVGFHNFNFDSDKEKEGFSKVAQGAIDPAMLAQAAGLPPMVDPSLVNMPQPVAAEGTPPPEAAAGVGAPAGIPQVSPQMAAVGEGITNKDIESLMKIMNILTTMKSDYDAMKNRIMEEVGVVRGLEIEDDVNYILIPMKSKNKEGKEVTTAWEIHKLSKKCKVAFKMYDDEDIRLNEDFKEVRGEPN